MGGLLFALKVLQTFVGMRFDDFRWPSTVDAPNMKPERNLLDRTQAAHPHARKYKRLLRPSAVVKQRSGK